MTKKKESYPEEMKDIVMDGVESSNIKSVGYVRLERNKRPALYVEFKNGDIWKYKEVPKDLYFDFMASASKGKFFCGIIKPVYDAVKVYPLKKEKDA